MEHISDEGRLGEPHSVRLLKRRVSLIRRSYCFLQVANARVQAIYKHSSWRCTVTAIGDNRHKLLRMKFQLDIKKVLLITRVAKHWKELSRDIESPLLDIFWFQLDDSWAVWPKLVLVSAGVWTTWSPCLGTP